VNIADTIDGARRALELTGRGRLVRIGEDEPHCATVAEIAARREPHEDAAMFVMAVSEAVERDHPSADAVILLETDSGFQVLILSPHGWDYAAGFHALLSTRQVFGAPLCGSKILAYNQG
jgi:hypothetical protein